MKRISSYTRALRKPPIKPPMVSMTSLDVPEASRATSPKGSQSPSLVSLLSMTATIAGSTIRPPSELYGERFSSISLDTDFPRISSEDSFGSRSPSINNEQSF